MGAMQSPGHAIRPAPAIVTLARRGVTFWMPLLGGMITFRLVGHSSPLNAWRPDGRLRIPD